MYVTVRILNKAKKLENIVNILKSKRYDIFLQNSWKKDLTYQTKLPIQINDLVVVPVFFKATKENQEVLAIVTGILPSNSQFDFPIKPILRKIEYSPELEQKAKEFDLKQIVDQQLKDFF